VALFSDMLTISLTKKTKKK